MINRSTRVIGKTRGRLAVALAVATVLSVAVVGPAEAGVTNPGPITLEFPTAAFALPNATFDFDTTGAPQCSDDINNDDHIDVGQGVQDTLIDFPDDPDCTSADDDSEDKSGFQPEQAVTFTGTVDADGNIDIPIAGVMIPTNYAWTNNSLVGGDKVNQTKFVATVPMTGTIDPDTGVVDLHIGFRLKLSIEGTGDLNGPGSRCFVGGIWDFSDIDFEFQTGTDTSATLGDLTGVPYDDADGGVSLVSFNKDDIQGATNCGAGGFGNAPVDSGLGTPAGIGEASFTLSGSTSPIITSGTAPTNEDPTAAFTATPNNLTVDFDASASSDTDGTIAAYDWDFGDTNTDTGVTPSHTYAAAGTYPVELTVTDDLGATDTTSQNVTVSPAGGTDDVVTVSLTGPYGYSNTGALTSGDISVGTDAQTGRVSRVAGVGTIPGTSGGDATFAISISSFLGLNMFTGSVNVIDDGAGVRVRTPILFRRVAKSGDTVSGTARWVDFSDFPWRSYSLSWSVQDVA